MPIISVREFGKLHIGELDPERPSITSSQAAHLRSLKRVTDLIFKFVNETTLSAQQYVGATQAGGLTVEVLPKIEGIADTTIRCNLVAMLSMALDLEISEGDVAKVATQNHGILEVLIRLFCDKLFAQVHRGLVRRYEGREENLPLLRGKLGVKEQVRLNAANPERLYCRFDEFQEDNPLNQILKAAVRLLLKASRELTNQRQLAELMLIFEGVSDVPRHSLPWHRIAFDRLNERYKPSYKLAQLFLTNTPPDVSGGGVQGFSLFFEMNSLFEEYVGRIARRVLHPEGYQVALQGPIRYLALDESSKRDVFAMKPDVVGLKDRAPQWIMDTKWKELSQEEAKEGVSQSDLYQMYAYANCYACSDVVLVYPHHAGMGATAGVRTSYQLKSWTGGGVARIRVATLDLSDLKSVPGQLSSILQCESSAVRLCAQLPNVRRNQQRT